MERHPINRRNGCKPRSVPGSETPGHPEVPVSPTGNRRIPRILVPGMLVDLCLAGPLLGSGLLEAKEAGRGG